MSFDRHFHQTLTYWAPGALDLYGKMTYAAPVQKLCRWEEVSLTYQDKKGEERQSKTRIFLVDDLDIDGYVFLGTSAATDPTQLDGAYEIQQKMRLPDLRAVRTMTTVIL